MSLPEVLLWQILRRRPGGFKFRRQHPVGEFVLDFYLAERKLAIEIDGIAHNMGDRADRDKSRDRWLEAQDLAVVRISAKDVLDDPTSVADSIARLCEAG